MSFEITDPKSASENDRIQAEIEHKLRSLPNSFLSSLFEEGAKIANLFHEACDGRELPSFDHGDIVIIRSMLDLAMSSMLREVYRRLDEQNEED